MKVIFGLSLLLLSMLVEGKYYSDCPLAKKDCAYTYNYDPVCSTLGCTYSNIKHMKCAGANFWYAGECLEPRGVPEEHQWRGAQD